jgi:hypothetical protein
MCNTMQQESKLYEFYTETFVTKQWEPDEFHRALHSDK